MLDINFIKENQDQVKKAARDKKVEVDIDRLLEVDEQRRQSIQKAEKLRSQLKVEGKPSAEDLEKLQGVKSEYEKERAILDKLEGEYTELISKVPNVPSDDTPIGKDETENKVVRQEGDKPSIAKAKSHWELGEEQDLIDLERAAKVSGSRLNYLKGNLVKLQFALIQFALSVLTDEAKLQEIAQKAGLDVATNPFVPALTPVLIRKEVFAKVGRLDPQEDKYILEEDGQVLAGSAEHALAPMHMDEVLDEKDLPLRYVGYSTNFRREAGSYGKDVRGILRQHQFDKLEMESFTVPGQGLDEQNFLVAIQEYLMQQLELPYQVVAICTGDMGKPDARQIDLETWMPGQEAYRETQTSDYMTDYQSRRLNIKYKSKDAKKMFVHMNDATVFAMGRTLIGIMENYQTSNGKIKVPKVLQSYYGGEEL